MQGSGTTEERWKCLERSWSLNKKCHSDTARRGTPEKVLSSLLWPGLNMVPVLLSPASQKRWRCDLHLHPIEMAEAAITGVGSAWITENMYFSANPGKANRETFH